MEIRALDLSDDATLAAAYGVECAATADARPGWVPLGETARVTAWRALGGWSRTLVGAFDGGELVGVASCATAADAPESAWVDVTVLPERQRAGVGSELAAAAEGVAARGVRRFVASVYRPSSDEADRLIQGFAVPLGYTVATTETVVEVDVTGGDVPSLAPRGDYSVHTYLNGVPDSLRREVGVLKGLVDAEAPSGALDWQPTPVSPRGVRRRARDVAAAGT